LCNFECEHGPIGVMCCQLLHDTDREVMHRRLRDLSSVSVAHYSESLDLLSIGVMCRRDRFRCKSCAPSPLFDVARVGPWSVRFLGKDKIIGTCLPVNYLLLPTSTEPSMDSERHEQDNRLPVVRWMLTNRVNFRIGFHLPLLVHIQRWLSDAYTAGPTQNRIRGPVNATSYPYPAC